MEELKAEITLSTNLSDVLIDGADLRGADLRGVIAPGVDFSKAIIDENTMLPENPNRDPHCENHLREALKKFRDFIIGEG